MIKVGILGASTRQGGELARILVNHPDVELVFAYDDEHIGQPLNKVHHGLTGETELTITDSLSLARLDVVIICKDSETAQKIALNPELYPRLRVIDLLGQYADNESIGMTLGLSEVNRKPLVRGATRASIPSAAVTASLIALYPFASSLLLNDDISITLSGLYTGDKEKESEKIAEFIRSVQNTFSSKVKINYDEGREDGYGRGMRAGITFPCTLRLEDALALYDPVYDDHNFTYIVGDSPDLKEVEGTQKCLISLKKPDASTITLSVVVDGVMRGGAGDAVHVMNLLFALHERTGLALKASCY